MKADDLTMDFTTENWHLTMKADGSNDVGFNNEKCWVQKMVDITMTIRLNCAKKNDLTHLWNLQWIGFKGIWWSQSASRCGIFQGSGNQEELTQPAGIRLNKWQWSVMVSDGQWGSINFSREKKWAASSNSPFPPNFIEKKKHADGGVL